MRSSRTSRVAPVPVRGVVSAAVTVAGLATGVVGTFLPWLRSGAVYRNSYETAAAIENLDVLSDPLVETALRSWIGVPLLTAICAGLFALGRLRLAATAALICAVIVGTVSALVLVQGGGTNELIAVTVPGPATTVVGMAIAAVGALGVFATSASRGDSNSVDNGRAGARR